MKSSRTVLDRFKTFSHKGNTHNPTHSQI